MTPVSTFLDGRTPAQLRGLQWLALSDTGYVLRNSATSDAGGGATTTFGTNGTFPCRVDALTGVEGEAGGQISDLSTHLITVPSNTDVAVTDRFQASDAGSFEITAVRTATAEMVRTIEAVKL